MAKTIDCVVVGYNDQRLDDLLQEHEPFKDVSGGYRHLLANSALFKGRRLKYFDLLNVVRANGPRDRLHVAKMPNLAVCYLVAYLRKQGLTVEYVNFFNDDQDHFRDLLQERPKAVAITTTFYFESRPIRDRYAISEACRRSRTRRCSSGQPRAARRSARSRWTAWRLV